MLRVSDSAVSASSSPCCERGVALPLVRTRSAHGIYFGAQWLLRLQLPTCLAVAGEGGCYTNDVTIAHVRFMASIGHRKITGGNY